MFEMPNQMGPKNLKLKIWTWISLGFGRRHKKTKKKYEKVLEKLIWTRLVQRQLGERAKKKKMLKYYFGL